MAGIEGTCAEGFAPVRQAFEENFAEGDLGASCAVVHRGELAVDLWGGHQDADRTRPWARDTISNIWSTTKMLAALCVLVLHDRGELSVDDPVAAHWPEFAAAGKDGVLVRHVLSHTAGLPGFDPAIGADDLFDWDRCCANLAAQAPWWTPGDGSGYHAATQGHLLGEVVRRVTGRTLGTFLRDEVAGPLGADVHLGLGDAELARVADMDVSELGPPRLATAMAERCEANEPDRSLLVNTERWRRAELPASNGHGNARAVVRVLSCLAQGGEVDGIRLLGPETIERTFEVQSDGVDRILDRHIRFGIGYALPSDDMPIGTNDRSLFWAGLGGSMAVVDVENELTVAYTMNKMLPDLAGAIRGARVIFSAHGAAAALRG